MGIDPSAPMITLAEKNAARSKSQAKFKLGVIEHLPFENGRFDVVLSSLMLHHLPSELKREGLDEVYRVLKPGGRLLAVDLDRPGHFLWWLVVWPQLLMPAVATNVRGEIPCYLHHAGFRRVQPVGRWFNLLTFWSAQR
jgi:demethylmenaquinone methyltransferase/2-methoxy-6-polyprenyl-1,4-benzoquinol methylase/phosphoethanolamine N-methyltransferase